MHFAPQLDRRAHLVILTKDKVYMASTDELDDLDGEVHRAGN
jgi:hypothetical protein